MGYRAMISASYLVVGLEGDAQAGAGCFGEALQGASGWEDFAALEAGDDGLGGSHSLGNLLLRHVGFGAGLDQGGCKGELSFERGVSGSVGGVLLPLREGFRCGNEFALH